MQLWPGSLRAFGVLIATLLIGAADIGAQQRGTIVGRVVDPQSGEPVVSAHVTVEGAPANALTGADGRFTLLNVPTGLRTVTAERIGYRRGVRRITIGLNQTAIANIEMPTDALELDAVIVTGTAGGTQKRALGNTVSSVTAASITQRVAVTDMQQMLTGRAAGVSLFRGVGNIGAGSPIRIRGVSSMQLGSQPMIFVDGVRVNNRTDLGPTQVGGRQTSSLDEFDPNELESVEIIKGPAAATLYGTEASAGVIQIITKRGKTGAPQFELLVNQGGNWLMNPAGKIGDAWACGVAFVNGQCPADKLVQFVDKATGISYRNLYDYETKVNHYNPLTTGRDQTYNLSVRGGTDAVRYYLSGDYASKVGMVSYNWNKRLNLRGNVSVILPSNISLDVSTGYVQGTTRYGAGDAGSDIWRMLMWGQPALLGTSLRGYLRATPEELATIDSERDANRFTGSMTATHRYKSWLTQRLIIGIDKANEESYTLWPRDPLGAAARFGQLNLGNIDLQRPLTTVATADYSANATIKLNSAFTSKSSFGVQYYSREYNTIFGLGSIFVATSIRSIDGASVKTIGQNFEQNKSLGLFVQQEMNWNDRAFLTAAVRGDGNSAFGVNYNAAIYPKLSGSWVLSEERFVKKIDFINTLRLRGAWGKAGRQPGTFAATTLYGPAVGPGGSAAVSPLLLGNPDLGPEVSTELELGFEGAILKNRISGEFTWYRQRITNALASVPLAPSQGFSGAQSQNLGRLDNWGWEASLKTRVFTNSKASLDLGLTGNHTQNEIKSLGVPPSSDVKVGYPFPAYSSAIIRFAEFNQFGTPNVATMMCDGGRGKNGLERGGATVPCSTMIGKELLLGPYFPTYTWGVDANLTVLRNIQVFAVAQGEYGRWNSSNTIYGSGAGAYNRTLPSVLRNDPVYIKSTLYATVPPNDLTSYIRYPADFWKLREIGVRYQLPQRFTRKLGASSTSLSVTGRGLWTIWTKTKLLQGIPVPDPEETNPTGGSIYGNFPPLSSFIVSARMTI